VRQTFSRSSRVKRFVPRATGFEAAYVVSRPETRSAALIGSAGKRSIRIRHHSEEMVPSYVYCAPGVPGLQWYKGDRTGLQTKDLARVPHYFLSV
jgi:hypothetical protein